MGLASRWRGGSPPAQAAQLSEKEGSRHSRDDTRLRVWQRPHRLLQGRRQPPLGRVRPEGGALRRWQALRRLRAARVHRNERGALHLWSTGSTGSHSPTCRRPSRAPTLASRWKAVTAFTTLKAGRCWSTSRTSSPAASAAHSCALNCF